MKTKTNGMVSAMTNNERLEKLSLQMGRELPIQIRKSWNWGAFLVPAFWGLGNGVFCWWMVILIIPHIVNVLAFLSTNTEWFSSVGFMIMAAIYFIVCATMGFFGNRMSLASRKLPDLKKFMLYQLKWSKFGFLTCFLGWLLWVVLIFGNMVVSAMHGQSAVTDVYVLGPMSGSIAVMLLVALFWGFRYHNKKITALKIEITQIEATEH